MEEDYRFLYISISQTSISIVYDTFDKKFKILYYGKIINLNSVEGNRIASQYIAI